MRKLQSFATERLEIYYQSR